jgi:hypothetical protein
VNVSAPKLFQIWILLQKEHLQTVCSFVFFVHAECDPHCTSCEIQGANRCDAAGFCDTANGFGFNSAENTCGGNLMSIVAISLAKGSVVLLSLLAIKCQERVVVLLAACANQAQCETCVVQGAGKCDSCKRGFIVNSAFTECIRKYSQDAH